MKQVTMIYSCPVCDYPGLDVKPYAIWPPPPTGVALSPPYNEWLGRPSYDVCVRCSYEFGFDDDPGFEDPGTSFEDYRAQWVADGKPWLAPEYIPPGYSEPQDQPEPQGR
jgi:hypothetical protein